MIKLLRTDDNFENIIEDTNDSIPKHIREYVSKILYSRMIIDNNKKYCSSCLCELNDDICINKYCHNYNKKLTNIINASIDNIKDYNENIYLLEFEIIHTDKVYLNKYEISIKYDNELIVKPRLLFDINKKDKYQIYKHGLYLINENKFIDYKVLTDILDGNDYDEFDDYYFEILNDDCYLYLDNLEMLSDTTLYKYKNLHLLKPKLNQDDVSIVLITYNVITILEFEYLVKMGLYDISLSGMIRFKNNFVDTFKVEKKYLNFMVSNDISYDMLLALRLYRTTNIEDLKYISDNLELFNKLKENRINIGKVLNYINNIKNDKEYYCDYLNICIALKLNLNDKNILFPKEFEDNYKKVFKEYSLFKNKEVDSNKMDKVYELLIFNYYEDDIYFIRPVKSIEDLIDESFQMHNCVRDYYEKIINDISQIYFLRKKDNPNESFVTIEVKNGKIVQAYEKYNKEVKSDIKKILDNWQSNLIIV